MGEGETDERVGGGGVDVERADDGGEIGGGEVEGVELGLGMLEGSVRERGNGERGTGEIPKHCVFGGRGGIDMLRSACSRVRGPCLRGLLRI